jgi:hypothetical protein
MMNSLKHNLYSIPATENSVAWNRCEFDTKGLPIDT